MTNLYGMIKEEYIVYLCIPINITFSYTNNTATHLKFGQ